MMEMGAGGKFVRHCIQVVELLWSSETWETGFQAHAKIAPGGDDLNLSG